MSSRRFQLATWVQSLASDPQPGTCPTPTHPPPPFPRGVTCGHQAWLSCFVNGERCGRVPRALLGVRTGHLPQADLA